MDIDIQSAKIQQRQAWLQYAIAPRPIAFASTIDKDGNVWYFILNGFSQLRDEKQLFNVSQYCRQ